MGPRTRLRHWWFRRRYATVIRDVMRAWRRRGLYSVGWDELLALHQAAWAAVGISRLDRERRFLLGGDQSSVLEDAAARAFADAFEIDQEAFASLVRAARVHRPAPDDVPPPPMQIPHDRVVIPEEEALVAMERTLRQSAPARLPRWLR